MPPTSEQLLLLLKQQDTSKSWEYPAGFQYSQEIARFQKFVEALEKATNLIFAVETGQQIQDASFHSQIRSPSYDQLSVVRFSNFGSMAAVAEEDVTAPELLEILLELLPLHGYVHIPKIVYSLPYTGTQVGIDPIITWWDRFFEWL
ncbi:MULTISPECIES: hypothetical protein [Hymenobacter]|uniref:Uncharacterized protein n=1 Tax=Hymenobacter mucosus TaxID=1411120 RepID=A0A239B2X4_9BACT|nr:MULTISPECIES: hypothetical protein [Hymenobacter]SNS01922.1 hypothetical protein SAMN06269173_11745 [Hymenobacter mucosus]